jgi:hypothetical protein
MSSVIELVSASLGDATDHAVLGRRWRRRMTGALAELMSPTALIVGDPSDRVLRVRFGAEESSYSRNRAG